MYKKLLSLFFLILFINCKGQDTLSKIDKSKLIILNTYKDIKDFTIKYKSEKKNNHI